MSSHDTGLDGRGTLRLKKFTKGKGCTCKTSTTKPTAQQKIYHPTKHTYTQKTCNIIPNEKEKIPPYPPSEIGEVNTCNVKMKETDEREIAYDKRGLVRDKAVDRSKGKKQWSG